MEKCPGAFLYKSDSLWIARGAEIVGDWGVQVGGKESNSPSAPACEAIPGRSERGGWAVGFCEGDFWRVLVIQLRCLK